MVAIVRRRQVHPLAGIVMAVTLTGALAGCGGDTEPAATRSVPSVTRSTASSTAKAPTTATAATPSASSAKPSKPPTPAPPAKPVSGRVVVIDPGHNGANAAHPDEINRQVPAGRGRTKPCNTTGTATNAGYTEHAFTWDVAVRVRDLLSARGVK